MRAYDFTQLGESASNPTYTTPSSDDDLATKAYVDGFASSAVPISVNQVAHGFAVGDIIYYDTSGGSWEKAISTADATRGTYFVTTVPTVDDFTANQSGEVTWTSHGLTPGDVHYTSASSAGDTTTTAPAQYTQRCFLVKDANTVQLQFLYPDGASGGGGGGSIIWSAPDGKAPIYEEEFSSNVWKFLDNGSQELWSVIKVPSTYGGAQIKLYIEAYSENTSNTWKLETTTYLVRNGTDAANSTTNSHASTNSNITNATTAYKSENIELDLTDSSGQINSVSVSAGDTLRIKLTRATGTTDTADIRLRDGAVELKTT